MCVYMRVLIVQYSRDKAEEILEELFHVGKIAPNDLTIFEDESLPKQWSRRIHTLERIADKVHDWLSSYRNGNIPSP